MLKNVSDTLTLAEDIVREIRQQNYADSIHGQTLLSEYLSGIVDDIPESYNEQLFIILTELMEAQTKGDYVLYADLLELELIPYLSDICIGLLEDKKPEEDFELCSSNYKCLKMKDRALYDIVERENGKTWQGGVEYTSSGYLTCYVERGNNKYYMHSNNNPRLEAEIFARQYYSIEDDYYAVFGLGLGYHIQAMLELDDGINIDIIESDIGMICCAMKNMDMSWLWDNERVRLIYDPTYTKWQESLKRCQTFVIHYPSMICVKDDTVKLQLQKFFIRDSGIRKYKTIFKNNFRENIVNCNVYVDELKGEFEGKNAVLVAAGPSLDKNVELLNRLPESTLIVAVGTVYRKLMNLGISPDYVVFLDAQTRNIRQIEELEDSEIPIIIASTATKQIGINYRGKKYLVCQSGYGKAELYAKEHGYQLYETGGSVSTITLDICIRLGCREIAFIGLDLAFTGGQSHSNDTLDNHAVSIEEENCEVLSWDGGTLKTSKLFLIYKDWMEKRGMQEDAIGKLIDATEGGASIEHWRKETLEEVLSRWEKLSLD